VLEIREGDAVTIKQIENSIIDRAWAEGWVTPQPPQRETGYAVAVVGSGPAGMAAAQQLRREGQRVVLFERDEAAGGLVRFGVPGLQDREDRRRAAASSSSSTRASSCASASTSAAT
jgi:glutamate synthase (NADPH/NADH) small chain